MPTNPTAPNSNAAIDRLTLGVDSPRGTEPSTPLSSCFCACFEAEASGPFHWASGCFEGEPSAVIFGCYGSSCFEGE